jgi:alkaline phosphatase
MRAACIAAGALAAAGTAHAQEARNIILMVTDGMGYNSWEATSYFQHGTLGQQIVDKPSMGHQWTDTSVFTRPLGHNGTLFPQDYNPHAAWQHEGYVTDFGTDSGAAATAMYTGQKTFNGRLSVDRYGDPLKSIADIASERGLATGAVTSVHWSHATPAAVAAKNVNRSDYIPIAQELVYESHLDVLMGAGHPWYDNAGQLKAAPSYNLVGGESTWNDLTSGGTGFSHVETLEAFEQLPTGRTTPPIGCSAPHRRAARCSCSVRARGGWAISIRTFLHWRR